MCNSRWLDFVYEGLTWWLESLKLSFLVEKKLRIEITIATLKKSGILLLDAAASTPDAESVYIPQDVPSKNGRVIGRGRFTVPPPFLKWGFF
jgi:hypothetical protein